MPLFRQSAHRVIALVGVAKVRMVEWVEVTEGVEVRSQAPIVSQL